MNQQFRYLFISNFVVLFTGMGLFPVLPLYATGLGATPTLVGFYFAIIFGANALGPVVVGRLSHRLSPRSLLVVAGWWGTVALALLLATCFMGALALNVGQLGTPLSMQALAFSPTAVASTGTVSGLLTIPVVLFIGALADRWGRERLMMTAYLLAAVGIGLLLAAAQLWHFWLAATLVMVAANASGAMAAALATDILPPTALSRGLPWIGVMGSGAGILSFAAAGLIIDQLGAAALFTGGVVIAVTAVLQLHWLSGSGEKAVELAGGPATVIGPLAAAAPES